MFGKRENWGIIGKLELKFFSLPGRKKNDIVFFKGIQRVEVD